VQGRLYQSAWNLAFFALATGLIAVIYNWNNRPEGYWLNLLMTSVTDIGFILFILKPRYLPLPSGLLGPALWLAAILFSSIGQFALRP